MSYEMMLKKDLIVELRIRDKRLSDEESDKRTAERLCKKLEDDIANQKTATNLERARLDNVRKAVETVIALKFPGSQIAETTPFTFPQEGMLGEPEELLALRHIFSLTSY